MIDDPRLARAELTIGELRGMIAMRNAEIERLRKIIATVVKCGEFYKREVVIEAAERAAETEE